MKPLIKINSNDFKQKYTRFITGNFWEGEPERHSEAAKLGWEFRSELKVKKDGASWGHRMTKGGGTDYWLSPPSKDRRGVYKHPDHHVNVEIDPQKTNKWCVLVWKKTYTKKGAINDIIYKKTNITKKEAKKEALINIRAINMGLE
jgi:hypothetical protein